jgi:hypothetical protein
LPPREQNGRHLDSAAKSIPTEMIPLGEIQLRFCQLSLPGCRSSWDMGQRKIGVQASSDEEVLSFYSLWLKLGFELILGDYFQEQEESC